MSEEFRAKNMTKKKEKAIPEVAMEEPKQMKTVDIKGKPYVMVHERIKYFNDTHPDCGLETKIVADDGSAVTIKATIKDKDGRVLATGHAQEIKGNGFINEFSHIENAETSAVGRCLGMMSIGIDASIASADEVSNAILNQKIDEQTKETKDYLEAVIEFVHTISAVKLGISNQDFSSAAEAWFELDHEQMARVWKAPTKGGCFTTKEREIMRSTEFKEARYGVGDNA